MAVTGEIDRATANQFREAALQAISAYTGILRINLAEMTFVGSPGLSTLVAIRNETNA